MFSLFRSTEYRKLIVMSTLVMAMLVNSVIPAYAKPNAPAVEDTWVQLVVLSVKNVDATNPEIPFVKVRISLAATAMSKYGIDVIAHEDLGTFREGQTKYYDDWVLAELPINQVTDFARLTLSMVEVDLGGRNDLLDRIAEEENEIARNNMLVYAI